MASKKTISQRKEQGICIYCGLNPCDSSKYTCEVCRDRTRRNAKIRRDKLKSSGICIKCGKNKTEGTHTKCEVCLSQQMQTYYRRAKTHETNIGKECLDCGIIVTKSNKRCENCYLKRRAVKHFKNVSLWLSIKDLFEKQNGICPYTGIQLEIGENAEIDHKVPKSKGGTDDVANLQWVYSPINTMKWNMTEDEFLRLIDMVWKKSNSALQTQFPRV